jgi:hypothetical protein
VTGQHAAHAGDAIIDHNSLFPLCRRGEPGTSTRKYLANAAGNSRKAIAGVPSFRSGLSLGASIGEDLGNEGLSGVKKGKLSDRHPTLSKHKYNNPMSSEAVEAVAFARIPAIQTKQPGRPFGLKMPACWNSMARTPL